MLTEKELQVLINGSRKYFQVNSGKDVTIETPYLTDTEEIPISELTGIIGVSGKRKGCVFVTATRTMLRYLVLSHGEDEVTPELLRDVIGEMANTISGNARVEFGPEFMISVPVVVEGKPDLIALPKDMKGYVIPMRWNSFPFLLVVSLR